MHAALAGRSRVGIRRAAARCFAEAPGPGAAGLRPRGPQQQLAPAFLRENTTQRGLRFPLDTEGAPSAAPRTFATANLVVEQRQQHLHAFGTGSRLVVGTTMVQPDAIAAERGLPPGIHRLVVAMGAFVAVGAVAASALGGARDDRDAYLRIAPRFEGYDASLMAGAAPPAYRERSGPSNPPASA